MPIPDLYLQGLGKSKQSITTALRDLQVSIDSDKWTGKEMRSYISGPTFYFWLNDPDQFDSFGFGNMGKTTNFILSKKYQIQPSFPIS